jgi:phosphoribosylaminoimidazolecarboxamide formyltransferase / IMP cyclohydrolase
MSDKIAIVSTANKFGIVDFCEKLADHGYNILSTSGTLSALESAGISCRSLAKYINYPEILDGRVKTLHPLIHGGLLADRNNNQHLADLAQNGANLIDILVVNLYPFKEKLSLRSLTVKEMIEFIDIGGPTMLRAAAKNFSSVIPLIDPADYNLITEYLDDLSKVPISLRRKLAAKVFATMADYDLSIAGYLSSFNEDNNLNIDKFSEYGGFVGKRSIDLRYGENPQQKGAFYEPFSKTSDHWEKIAGKELSYNNLLDLSAALSLIKGLNDNLEDTEKTVAILKHTNPCGVAIANSSLSALISAQSGDPRSHFGGIIVTSHGVDEELARKISETFYEIVVAPSFSEEARGVLTKKLALRLITYNKEYREPREFRSVEGGYLQQESDLSRFSLDDLQTVSGELNKELQKELALAWNICRFVKSNAIVLVKNRALLGVGAGQMSRIDSTEIAINKAKSFNHDLQGAVAASDAFFPFPDSVERLAEVGVTAIITPYGSRMDGEVISLAQSKGINLFFIPTRHFKH